MSRLIPIKTTCDACGVKSNQPLTNSQASLLLTQADLVLVVVQMVVVRIPMNQGSKSPTWLCISLKMTSLQVTHIRLFQLMISSPFPFFPDRTLKGLTAVTTFHPRLLHSEGTTIMNWVMLDLATLVHLPLTILLIDKDM